MNIPVSEYSSSSSDGPACLFSKDSSSTSTSSTILESLEGYRDRWRGTYLGYWRDDYWKNKLLLALDCWMLIIWSSRKWSFFLGSKTLGHIWYPCQYLVLGGAKLNLTTCEVKYIKYDTPLSPKGTRDSWLTYQIVLQVAFSSKPAKRVRWSKYLSPASFYIK